MRATINYYLNYHKGELEDRIYTPGLDWGYANGQFLVVIYETMHYYILKSKGTGYHSGQDTLYSPAEYMIGKKLRLPNKRVPGEIKIALDNVCPGGKWREKVQELKDRIDRLEEW